MNEDHYVKSCPYCVDHPVFLPGTLQCVQCGALRPRRIVKVTWEGGSTEERTLVQEALDLHLHSGRHLGSVRAKLTRASAGRWRVEGETITPPADGAAAQLPPEAASSQPWLLAGDVKRALERSGLGIAE